MKRNTLFDNIFFNIFGFLIYLTGVIIRLFANIKRFFKGNKG